jgi:hypothetical protein
LSGGKVYTYIPTTYTNKTTWADSSQSSANTNPIILDSSGMALIYGAGQYRFIIKDANDNLVYDQLTNATLDDSTISSVMLPVVSAATTQTARDLMGVTSAIQAAIANASLLAGPTGPTGVTGPSGPTGVPGTSSNYSPFLNGSNPGLFKLSNVNNSSLNFYIQFGSGVTNGGGYDTMTFAQAFPNGCLSVVASAGNTSWWAAVIGYNTNNFTVTTSSPLVGGSWLGSQTYHWMAVGY